MRHVKIVANILSQQLNDTIFGDRNIFVCLFVAYVVGLVACIA